MTQGPIILRGTAIRSLGLPDDLDFFDSQTATLGRAVTPLEAWNIIMSQPMPLIGLAFRARDAISARFGVQRIGGFSGARPDRVEVGGKLAFFDVEESAADALVLTSRDRHLDVMTCISVEGCDVTIASSVRTHNRFGIAYMIPVAPAHRMIVKGMLRRLAKDTSP